ncbi:MAG: Beta-Casp domain-containing protein [Candidatus Jorgensenbacteria bacterium GW2011_GWA1_48_13]|uniref:Beta-Casp domain-containing protein n=2 Tax=Candidatus Joergenseniibacteriota TaxID=1752739 RepID=A0A0G1W9Q6_9BACT|nr:MAG: Beta-Casp domain-containing protein [Candidatus Jorgensenbacteria bacterium GW2011_GWA1_48_13]KKU98855.1 MAG: RNA-metabolising metallo-beta-lactamase [Candidatus Jorgensenbacteria bacterium GW2011_GWC1_48_8]KKW15315.1 MAG: Beta-Casp domain-containing protein [Candidatus Jorgensenbacteria bacterium GW2011_GWB1_50_10]
MKLTFWGGAKMVTGANYLLESGGTKILIDCGLHQGSRYCERHNFEPFPYKPEEITAVFVTHAHIDHIGRLPSLYRAGFRGEIYSTGPTKDFAELLLLDSEHILRREAEREKKPPLYDTNDVVQTMGLWRKQSYHEKVTVGPYEIEFYDAGHILGSSSLVVKTEGKTAVFSGDLGNTPAPLIKPVEYVKEANYALVESVYGGRVHERPEARKDQLENLIEDIVKSGGTLMIPSFALERTQELLTELNELVENGRIPRVPIFIDSPLAIRLTSVYQKYSTDPRYFNKEAIAAIQGGDAIFNFAGLKMTLTTEQSKEINNVPPPKVIVAGAGMSNGGRILHHEQRYLSDPKSAILFIGYQAKGSLGREILDGADSVKIYGEEIPVRCKKVAIGGYSAHADQPQLLRWASSMRGSLKKIFVVQGEEKEAGALAQKIKDELAIEAEIPSLGEEAVL